MHQIVYISTSRSELTPSDVSHLLETSIANNGRVGVTGLLVRGRDRFLQVLEGPEPAVIQTYERIRHDSRHVDCVQLSSRSVSRRAFGSWATAMGEEGSSQVVDVRSEVERLLASIEDSAVRAEFTAFADRHAIV